MDLPCPQFLHCERWNVLIWPFRALSVSCRLMQKHYVSLLQTLERSFSVLEVMRIPFKRFSKAVSKRNSKDCNGILHT